MLGFYAIQRCQKLWTIVCQNHYQRESVIFCSYIPFLTTCCLKTKPEGICAHMANCWIDVGVCQGTKTESIFQEINFLDR